MNRTYREMTTQEIIAALNAAKFCWLSTLNNSSPYLVPMCFTFRWQDGEFTFLLQSSTQGKKADCLAENPQVMLSVTEDDEGSVATVLAEGRAKLLPPSCHCQRKMDIEVTVTEISGRIYQKPVCDAAPRSAASSSAREDGLYYDTPLPRRERTPRYDTAPTARDDDYARPEARPAGRSDRYEKPRQESRQEPRYYDSRTSTPREEPAAKNRAEEAREELRYSRDVRYDRERQQPRVQPEWDVVREPAPEPAKPPRPERYTRCVSENKADRLWRRYEDARRESVALRLEQTNMRTVEKGDRLREFDRVRTSDVASFNEKSGALKFRKNGIYRLTAIAGAENPEQDGDRLRVALWCLNENCLVERLAFKPAGDVEYQLDARVIFEVTDKMFAFVLKNASTDTLNAKASFLVEKLK